MRNHKSDPINGIFMAELQRQAINKQIMKVNSCIQPGCLTCVDALLSERGSHVRMSLPLMKLGDHCIHSMACADCEKPLIAGCLVPSIVILIYSPRQL